MSRATSFAPHVHRNVRLLILGSLPGTASLAAGQYYAHPRNQFWRLLGDVLHTDLAALPYAGRLDALAAKRVGLWDVVKSAERAGSLDADIRQVATNDLHNLVERLPDLRALAFNGATAHKIGHRQLTGKAAVCLVKLPSSSPAHAAMPYAEKLQIWSGLRRFL